MAKIERRYLAPPNPATTITEADRARVHEIIGKQVANILTGDQSYYPDGVPKDSQSIATELSDFIASIDNLRGGVNDPSNILGDVVHQLTRHAGDLQDASEKNEPVDKMELPKELSPTTEDNRVIHVDPDPNQFSQPNPLSPKNWSKELKAALGLSDNAESASVGALPDNATRLLDRRANSALAGNNIGSRPGPLLRTVGLPGIYSGRPMPQWIVPPPIFGRR